MWAVNAIGAGGAGGTASLAIAAFFILGSAGGRRPGRRRRRSKLGRPAAWNNSKATRQGQGSRRQAGPPRQVEGGQGSACKESAAGRNRRLLFLVLDDH